ncbi:MAG: TonB-dependent receptor [Sphingobium sp.]
MNAHAPITPLAAIALAALLPATAASQTAETAQAEDPLGGEIVVTARKRSERAIDVPASLNVFSGENLQSSGVTTIADLQYQTPGLKVAVGGGSTRISLRGVGTNIAAGGPSVAVHLDGIYVPNTRLAIAEMFDVDRVEVLKGPEGTLYGRNATGGAINIISRAPGDNFAADGYVGYGSRDLMTAQAGVTVPLGERGGLRLSGAYADDDGYTKNINAAGGEIDDRHYAGLRLRGHYALTDTLTADFTAQYARDKGTTGFGGSNNPDSPVYAGIAPQRENPRRVNFDVPPEFDQKALLLSGTLTLDLSGVTLKSVTGHIDYSTRERSDVDGAGGLIAYVVSEVDSGFFSQEFQISGGRPGAVSWTAGAYYARETFGGFGTEIDSDYPVVDPYVYTDVTQHRVSKSRALFGEVTVPLSSRLSVLAGARYTRERQVSEGVFAAPLFLPDPIALRAVAKSDAFTPKLLVEYRPYDGGKLYASATRGFKSGGANLETTATVFRPERIWAYEIGSKNRTADGRAEFGIAAFYYDYTDLQLRTTLFTPQGIFTRITNAASASILGLELSAIVRPAEGLSLDFNGAWLKTRLKDFISPVTEERVIGLPMPLTPRLSFTAGAQYRLDMGASGSITARGEVSYQSSVNFPQFTDFERERQSGYALLNANLRYDLPGGRMHVALIGRNLTNRLYKTQRFYYAGFADTEFYGAPRTVEARLGFSF